MSVWRRGRAHSAWRGRRAPGFLRAVRPVLELYASWFRPEVRGFDRLPDRGPFLVVGNHSGGQTPPDLPVLLTAWWRERGEDEPVYALFHSFVMGTPGVATVLGRGGAVEADRETAEGILRGGGVLIDFPGGTSTSSGRGGTGTTSTSTAVSVSSAWPCGPVSRWSRRCRSAPTNGGGPGPRERLARTLGIDRLFRIKVMPLVLGPPWGVVPGGIPTLPLPAKITVELGEPIDWPSVYGPEAADDDEIVGRCYRELTETMQATLDRLAAERHYPVIG